MAVSGTFFQATQPVSGTVTANAGTGTLAVSGPLTDTQIRATALPVSGTVTANAGTGTLAVSAASLPLPSGASTAAKQAALGTAGASSTDVLSVQGIASGTALAANQTQVNGVAVSTGNGVTGTGVQRVTIASDQTSFGVSIAQSGTTASVYGQAFAAADGINAGGNMAVSAFQGVFNGTSWDRARGDTNGTVSIPALTSTYWNYTSGTTPILSNTTVAVTIKAAAGASVRNYISSCQITTTSFTTSGPLALRDGAAGAVLWALVVPTAGFTMPAIINFVPPLRGTANTLVEIVTTTANTSGTVTANCQGFTGA